MNATAIQFRSLAILLITVAGMSVRVHAQGNLGTFLGAVRDASGAVIPAVKVTVVNEANQFTRTAVTDSNGDYRFEALDPATYSISAESAGFRKYVNTSLTLLSRQIRRVDIVLEVGETATTLFVQDAAPVVQSENATLQTNLGTQFLNQFNVPLTKQEMERMAFNLAPGAGRAQYSVYGSREGQVIWMQDGAELQANQFTTPGFAFQEIKVVALNAPAEYDTPNVSDATTKSGSNDFHGYALALFSNPALNAIRNSFAHVRPKGIPNNDYVFGGGGPVYIPSVYNGRNRTFFWVTARYQPATKIPYAQTYTVPTPAMRDGDLSILGKTIRDPYTGVTFPGAIIPSRLINPASARILQTIVPAPSQPGQLLNNLTAIEAQSNSRQIWWALRVDQKLTTNNTLTGTLYYYNFRYLADQAIAGTAAGVPGYGVNGAQKRKISSVMLADTHVFSARVVNEFRARYFRVYAPSQPSESGQEILQKAGLVGVTDRSGPGGPLFSLNGYSPWTVMNTSVDGLTNIHVLDNLTFVKGTHTLKTGFDIKAYSENLLTLPAAAFGQFTFTGALTGDPFADFLFGIPTTLVRQDTRPEEGRRSKEYGFYFQDDWKVTPKLTVNLGLRYSISPPQREVNGLYYNYDPVTRSMVVPTEKALASVQAAWPTTIPVVTAGRVGFPDKLINTDKNNFAPRAGFAYRLGSGNRTVVRGAYGVYYFPVVGGSGGFALLQSSTGPFGVTETFQNTPGRVQFVFPNPFGTSVGSVSTPSVTAIARDFVQPYTQQWNIFLERQIRDKTSVSIGYVGVADRKLGYQANINEPFPSSSPFSQARRPNPSLVNVIAVQNGGVSNYRTLQLELNRQWSGGFWLKAYYNLAKQTSDVPAGRFEKLNGSAIENPYDRRREMAPSDFTTTHTWFAESVWDVPVGHHRSHLRGLPGVLNAVIGDWSITAVVGFHSGLPYSATFSGSDPSGTGTFGGRADLVPGCNPELANRSNARYFDVSCFAIPPAGAGRFGNSPRNLLRGPSSWADDLSVAKPFYITERLNLGFMAQFVNILNHPNFANPQADITAPNAGQIFRNTQNAHNLYDMRQIFFHVKLEF